MTRKDFRVVADALLIACVNMEYPQRKQVAEDVAMKLKLEYPHFDRDIFLRYMGL